MNYSTAELLKHYQRTWVGSDRFRELNPVGPIHQSAPNFTILEIKPGRNRPLWSYATIGMGSGLGIEPLELHVFSHQQNPRWAEILPAIADYHRSGHPLSVGHTVNLGVPIMDGSDLSFGLISLPYLDGPELEEFQTKDGLVRCLWLIPISQAELDFKKRYGLEQLEQAFEKRVFDYADSFRKSVV